MHPTGTTGLPPERGSVPSEPVRTQQATAQEWDSEPRAASSQSTRTDHSPSSSFLPFCFRIQIEELTLELSGTLRKLEISEKEKRQFQKTVTEQEMALNEQLDRIKTLQYQV